MQIPVVKKLIEEVSLKQLQQAEDNLMEELPLGIEVGGADEGEQLTHIIAATWILEKMRDDEMPFPKALRAYTQKVRTSIGG